MPRCWQAEGLPHHNLLTPGAQKIKRVFDVAVALFLMVLAFPFALAIALAIVLETPGPVFFAHMRVGKNHRRFRLWKLRSMVVDADAALERHLERHPEHRWEWRNTHKLKDDPRGDMSMAGPRPIVEEEMAKDGPALSLYSQVLPGLTGLWQVSGRNDTRYILNWTMWMDVVVLLKTVRVVLLGHGAY